MKREENGVRSKSTLSIKSLFEILRGVMLAACGFFLFYPEKFGLQLRFNPSFVKIIGALVLFYGLYRLIHGIIKLVAKPIQN
ncbi:MAG: hypothetical protein ACYCOO_05980 [Chitinophagaceae bacterium]